jgi:hypothetical protein
MAVLFLVGLFCFDNILPQAHRYKFNMNPCKHVEKNAVATPNQAKKNNATAKTKLSVKLSCGSRKTKPST